jgi:nuclear protein localization family protein 4
MSFHAYLRKLAGKNKQQFTLEEPSFAVKKNCDTGHAPFPQSMCAKCQPSAIVLQQQVILMSFYHLRPSWRIVLRFHNSIIISMT